MYVCLCNCVTDQQLVDAAIEFASEPAIEGSASLAEQIADRLGAGLGCGTCREFALDLVKRAATQQSSVVLTHHVLVPADVAGSRKDSVSYHSNTLLSETMTPLCTGESEAAAASGNHALRGTMSAI